MTTHTFPANATSETGTTVTWRCSKCHRVIEFAKEGYGEPHASTIEYPAEIDTWFGECPLAPDASRLIPRDEFLLRLTSSELGALSAAVDYRLQGMLRRIELSDQIAIDAPELLSDLQYAYAQGIFLDANRPSEIVA